MLISLVALVPSLFWLLIFLAAEKPGHRESPGALAKAFVFGMLSTVLVSIVYELVNLVVPVPVSLGGFQSLELLPLLLVSVLVVGPVEELCKLLATRAAIYKEKTFDEPCDGIVFAAAAALGFAFAEHLMYFHVAIPAFLAGKAGLPNQLGVPDSTWMLYAAIGARALSPPMHPLASAIWGAALGKRMLVPGTPFSVLLRGLAGAALLHGLFDFCLIGSRRYSWLMLLWVFLIVSSIVITRKAYCELSKPSGGLPLPVVRSNGQFQIKYAIFAFMIAAVTEGIGAFAFFQLGGNVEVFRDQSFSSWTTAVVTAVGAYYIIAFSGLFLAGLISGLASPGRTVKEAAIGIFLSSVITTLCEPWHTSPSDTILGAVFCTFIGTFGAWLGELLQPKNQGSVSV